MQTNPINITLACLTAALLLASAHPTAGQEQGQSATPTTRPAPEAEVESPAEKPATKPPAQKTRTSKAWGTRVEPEPPSYVKTLDKFGIESFKDVDWLEFGLENQTRYEYRHQLRRPDFGDDHDFLMRSRVYIGVREIFDPVRFAFEFQDSREFNSELGPTTRDVDEADFLQAFVELYFADALGPGYPIQFRAGRMTLEYVDRRLVGRNRWRNTTNSFEGFRLRFGQPDADWQFDFFAVQPVEVRMTSPDRADEERWFYGLVGAWRRWSDTITLEPYYFILDEDRKDPTRDDREIHTMGVHGFGPIGKTNFDYDFDAAFQFGEDGSRKQRAFAFFGELGYTFEHAWKPRLSFSTMYATGDRNPNDSLSERFDRLFEVTHPPSITDMFSWQNIIAPKLRLELRPTDKMRLTSSYGAYWLASDSDAWVIPGLRDRSGDSGDFVGQEIDATFRWQINPRLELELGYAHFLPGGFAESVARLDDGDMFYVQTRLSL